MKKSELKALILECKQELAEEGNPVLPELKTAIEKFDAVFDDFRKHGIYENDYNRGDKFDNTINAGYLKDSDIPVIEAAVKALEELQKVNR